MGPTWPNLGPRCAPDGLTSLNIRPIEANIGVTCAPQTQVGRRPAVRRKPLNLGLLGTLAGRASRGHENQSNCGPAGPSLPRSYNAPPPSAKLAWSESLDLQAAIDNAQPHDETEPPANLEGESHPAEATKTPSFPRDWSFHGVYGISNPGSHGPIFKTIPVHRSL